MEKLKTKEFPACLTKTFKLKVKQSPKQPSPEPQETDSVPVRLIVVTGEAATAKTNR